MKTPVKTSVKSPTKTPLKTTVKTPLKNSREKIVSPFGKALREVMHFAAWPVPTSHRQRAPAPQMVGSSIELQFPGQPGKEPAIDGKTPQFGSLRRPFY